MPPPKMSWAWIAGFFEGEGNVRWTYSRKGNCVWGGPRITIGQKDIRPLKAMKGFLLRHQFVNPVLAKRKTKNLWVLALGRQDDAISFLEQVTPLLYEKRREAQRVLLDQSRAAMQARRDVVGAALEMRAAGKLWYEIAEMMGVHWANLKRKLEAAGIQVKPEMVNKNARNYQTRLARNRTGQCIVCSNQRGKDGTPLYCRPCANHRNTSLRAKRVAKTNAA